MTLIRTVWRYRIVVFIVALSTALLLLFTPAGMLCFGCGGLVNQPPEPGMLSVQRAAIYAVFGLLGFFAIVIYAIGRVTGLNQKDDR